MRKSVLLLLSAVCLAAACSGARPGDDFTMRDQTTIRERTDAFVKAFNAKEIDQILGIYAENSVFMPPNEPIIRGKDALKTFYTDLIKAGASDLRLNIAEVSGHGPLAYETGTYELNRAGNTRDRGKYIFVLRKLADTWRFEYTVWNSDLPAAPTAKDP
jgi:ketosteroid isomerase-like protein